MRRLRATLVVLALTESIPALAEPTPEESAIADALFSRGRELMREGRYAEACERLAESQRLDPSGGTLLNLASCRALEGRTATAQTLFHEALAMARAQSRADRIDEAQRGLAALAPDLAYVVVEVPFEPRPSGLRVVLNGAELPLVAWGTRVAVDPGTVIVEVSAPGYPTQRAELSVAKAGVVEHAVRALEALPPSAPASSSPAAGDIAWRPSVTARVDVDGELRGATAFVGVGVGVTNHLDVGAGALLGGSFGLEIVLAALPFEGPLRPFLAVACPVFFEEGEPFPGVRAGAGASWFVWDHLSFLASSSVALFPGAPAGVDPAVFVPSLGVTGRL